MAPELPGELLRGETAAAPTPEDGLRLGPGWLGPTTGIGLVRALNTQAAAAWFYRQIVRIARDEQPDPGLSAARALRQHAANEWRLSRARRFKA